MVHLSIIRAKSIYVGDIDDFTRDDGTPFSVCELRVETEDNGTMTISLHANKREVLERLAETKVECAKEE